MKRLGTWFLLGNLIFLFTSLFLIFVAFVMVSGKEEGSLFYSNALAVIEIKDTLLDPEEILEQIDRAYKNDKIKGVILRIDSPGGAVGAAQEIYQSVLRLKEKKIVVASVGNVAASGGYYIAVAANKIVANPGSVTGSIGVLMDYVNVEELLKFTKVHAEILKAGALKDIGSPLRPIKPEERQFLQNLLEDMHRQFKAAVAKGRSLKIEQVEPLADGRVFTGEQALKLGLIDQLGGQQAAIEVAKTLAGISGELEILYPKEKKKGLIRFLMNEDVESRLMHWFYSLQEKKAMYLMR